MGKTLASGIIMGIGIGMYIPSLPGILSKLNIYLGLILIIIGIVILINSRE
ncbi:MAG: hypothetical protein PHR26_01155 [Candidatus ainarchaeum sp.]|nr:hypothetical protein [Candidatus ainarchaeum sp.]MDD3976010.1 hypothetical protein [Candidatus ainarchaeum sp.]